MRSRKEKQWDCMVLGSPGNPPDTTTISAAFKGSTKVDPPGTSTDSMAPPPTQSGEEQSDLPLATEAIFMDSEDRMIHFSQGLGYECSGRGQLVFGTSPKQNLLPLPNPKPIQKTQVISETSPRSGKRAH